MDGHESNLLNQVCIDTQCKNRGLICLFCQYHSHKGHEIRPLKIFLNEYQANYKKFEENEYVSAEKDNKAIVESYQGIHECISVFQGIINEQIDKLKDDLQNQIQIKKKLLQDTSLGDGSMTFQKALSNILENECVSAEEQIQCISVLVSKVNSVNMAIEFKGKKQIQNQKEIKYKIQEIEQSKNKIAVCMSRITDELTVITKQVSDLVFDSLEIQQQLEKAQIKQPSPAKPIEQTRSVLKAVPQKISNNKKQMEKMFKGNMPTDVKLENDSTTMDDLFSSQWNEETNYKYSKNQMLQEPKTTATEDIYHKEQEKISANKGISRQSSEENSDYESNPERNNGKKNGKKREVERTKKAVKKKEKNDMIDEKDEYAEAKKVQENFQVEEQQNNDQFYDCSQAKQQMFSSSYTQQEINLDVKVGVKFKAHEGIAKDVIFLDEQRLATCSYDRQIKIWDIVEKKLIATLKGHEGRIMQIKYSKKHKLIGSAGRDKLAMLWQDITYQLAQKLSGHKESVMSIEFIDDRDIVVTGGSDKQIKIWCIFSGKQLFKVDNCVDIIQQIKYDTTNELLFTGGHQNITIYIFKELKSLENIKNQEEYLKARSLISEVTHFQGHDDTINMIQPIKVKGIQYFITCSDDKTLKLWDFDKLEMIQQIKEDTEISAFCFFEKLGIIVISMWGYLGGGRTTFYDFSDFTKIQDVESINTGTTSLKMNEYQNKLVSSHENGEIQLYYMNY
ncbi:hypothetical protein ABPG74_003444 [Tetrahymena malaccensis]